MGLRGPVIVPNAGYDTADGKLMIVVGTDRQFRAFCNAIGRPELADDERFARNDGRWTHEPVLNAEITDTLMTAPRAHWAAKLDAAGVPNAPIQDVGEASRHPQVEAGGQLQASPDGGFRLIGPPLRFDGVRPPFRQPAPQLGEATRQVFSRLHERSGT
jgi:crotonobetainyl-CoA:carnitine CoA-transferase CaiB-like acyl-CoA transferase